MKKDEMIKICRIHFAFVKFARIQYELNTSKETSCVNI